MCARLGIHHNFSPPYHHQANGRAEMAGQQIQEFLRRAYNDTGENWVEALPRVLDCIHDMEGPLGLSPYQMLFGRDRPLSGLPYPAPRYAEAANGFFNRMEELDKGIEENWKVLHEKLRVQWNKKLKEPLIFGAGQTVWYRRPEKSGHKLDTRWIGPCVVKERVGEHTYRIEVGTGVYLEAHATFLKPYHLDYTSGDPVQFFRYRRTQKGNKKYDGEELHSDEDEEEELV